MLRRTSNLCALAALSISTLMPSLDTSIANVALPTLARGFAASFQEVRWTVLAYLLAVTTSLVAAGRLGDVIGRRRLLLAGIAVFTAASLACGVAASLTFLIVARAVQGAGAAAMMALSMATAGELAGPRAGSAIGLLGTMSAIGTTLGAPVGGALIGWFGWRVIFLVNIPLGLAAVVLVYLSIPADRLLPAPPTALFDTAMFRERQLLSSLTMSVLVSAVVMTTLVVGPFYLDRVLQLDPAHIGLVMSAGPMVAALSGVPSGRIVDRIGAARATAAGLIVAALGCVALSALPAALGVPGYIIPIGFVTSGYALFQASNATALIMLTPPARRGAVSGLLALSRNAGLITGTWAMGAVFALASTSAAGVAATSAAAAAAGMRSTFAVSAILIILALAIAASAGKPHDKSFLVNP